MNNSMVAHLWAHEQEESASGSNFFFEGTSIYSYGHHFEVGRIVKNKQGKKAYLINEDYYSATTSKHQCYVRNAIPTQAMVFKDYTFPIQDLVEYKKKSNAFWIKRIDNLLKYYKRNRITLAESSFEYTVLMDEPDRNLDIDNIMQIYNVLSFHKPQTQIIAIIHNPALIYKLSKLDCVNFIEMTEGYLKDVVNFISETNK